MSDDKGQCTGKIRFRSYKAAKRLATMVSRRKDIAAQPYPCPLCKGFHIGSSLAHGAGDGQRPPPYARKPYAVYAKPPDGAGILVGWSVHEDGHDVAAVLGPGWSITSVVKRARARA